MAYRGRSMTACSGNNTSWLSGQRRRDMFSSHPPASRPQVPPSARPHVVHAGQGHKVGLHTPTILGGNSHLSWFYDRGAIKDPVHTGTSKGIAQAIKRGPIRKFLPNYANVYVTIQSHALSAGVRAHYVTGVRNGLTLGKPPLVLWLATRGRS